MVDGRVRAANVLGFGGPLELSCRGNSNLVSINPAASANPISGLFSGVVPPDAQAAGPDAPIPRAVQTLLLHAGRGRSSVLGQHRGSATSY